MGKLALWAVVAITAVVTAVLTSLFWIAAYSVALPAAPEAASSTPEAESTQIAQAGRPSLIVGPSGLAIPVAGVRADQLLDTYTPARAGGRPHDAIDIMAPAGTPVVAAAEGTIEKLYFSEGGGGITAYVRSPDQRWTYYYAHLQAYAPGLREGRRVARGDPIGLVGSTGNANPAGPHLHFAIHQMGPEERWWQGRAVNPYPLLAGRGTGR
jgi:peptidoglycan LD-endopeptidase LytH